MAVASSPQRLAYLPAMLTAWSTSSWYSDLSGAVKSNTGKTQEAVTAGTAESDGSVTAGGLGKSHMQSVENT